MNARQEIRAILDVVAEFEGLQNDPAGFTALLAEDVVLVNAVGRRVLGRARVLEAMQAAMATPKRMARGQSSWSTTRWSRPEPGSSAPEPRSFPVRAAPTNNAI